MRILLDGTDENVMYLCRLPEGWAWLSEEERQELMDGTTNFDRPVARSRQQAMEDARMMWGRPPWKLRFRP